MRGQKNSLTRGVLLYLLDVCINLKMTAMCFPPWCADGDVRRGWTRGVLRALCARPLWCVRWCSREPRPGMQRTPSAVSMSSCRRLQKANSCFLLCPVHMEWFFDVRSKKKLEWRSDFLSQTKHRTYLYDFYRSVIWRTWHYFYRSYCVWQWQARSDCCITSL